MAGSGTGNGYRWNRLGYTLDATGEKFDRVTTIKNVLGSGQGLIDWAAGRVAARATDLAERFRDGRIGRDELLVGLLDPSLGQAHNEERDRAADFGTVFHSLVEAWATGRKAEFPANPDLLARATHFLEWERSNSPRWIVNEFPVFSRAHRYAGTCDAVVEIGGRTLIVDVKTSKSVHADYALQLAAYRYAEFRMEDGVETPISPVDSCAILHVAPDKCELLELEAGPEQFDAFLACRRLLDWRRSQKAPVPFRPVLHRWATGEPTPEEEAAVWA